MCHEPTHIRSTTSSPILGQPSEIRIPRLAEIRDHLKAPPQPGALEEASGRTRSLCERTTIGLTRRPTCTLLVHVRPSEQVLGARPRPVPG